MDKLIKVLKKFDRGFIDFSIAEMMLLDVYSRGECTKEEYDKAIADLNG